LSAALCLRFIRGEKTESDAIVGLQLAELPEFARRERDRTDEAAE
jgi:hypothetical protein